MKRECSSINSFIHKPLYPNLSPLLLAVCCCGEHLVDDALTVLVGEECVVTVAAQETTRIHQPYVAGPVLHRILWSNI